MMSTADTNFPRTQHCLTLAWPLHTMPTLSNLHILCLPCWPLHTLPTLPNLHTLLTLNHAAFFAFLSGCLLQYSLSLPKPM